MHVCVCVCVFVCVCVCVCVCWCVMVRDDGVLLTTSSSFPVCMDHTNISKVSSDPALTTSLLGLSAKHANCTGRGDANVRKLRYLKQANII